MMHRASLSLNGYTVFLNDTVMINEEAFFRCLREGAYYSECFIQNSHQQAPIYDLCIGIRTKTASFMHNRILVSQNFARTQMYSNKMTRLSRLEAKHTDGDVHVERRWEVKVLIMHI